jgi:hypothetical protein
MSDEDFGVARYQRPPRNGQFEPGQSGNPRGRPKGSRNIRTYVQLLLATKIAVVENGGKTRKIPRAEAIAIQLVNLASRGDPKGLAAVMSMTREFDGATGDGRQIALSRPEDAAVLEGMIARMRAGDLGSTSNAISEHSIGNSGDEPDTASNPDPDAEPAVP